MEVAPPAWGENLKEAAESETLRRLAEESSRRDREARGKGVGGGREPAAGGEAVHEEVSSSSTSSSKKKKKGKKKKKKKAKAFKVQGKKDLAKVFEFTGLDPKLKNRKKVMKHARKSHEAPFEGGTAGDSSCSSTEGSSSKWRRNTPVRGDAQDQEGCNEGAWHTISSSHHSRACPGACSLTKACLSRFTMVQCRA